MEYNLRFLYTNEYKVKYKYLPGTVAQNNTKSLYSGNIKLSVAPYTGELEGWLI